MRTLLILCLYLFLFTGCKKEETAKQGCNMEKVYSDNAKKVSITNGIWGTVANMEGDFMPTIPPAPDRGSVCPVQRTIKIFQYTKIQDATPIQAIGGFYDSFNRPLVAQADSDENGFYQVTIPPGTYSVAIVENGKLYANTLDSAGGINPVIFAGGLLNFNITMTYKATF